MKAFYRYMYNETVFVYHEFYKLQNYYNLHCFVAYVVTNTGMVYYSFFLPVTMTSQLLIYSMFYSKGTRRIMFDFKLTLAKGFSQSVGL
jgi:hypothetical protein